ncbi:MAG TPA: hypothetical protein VJ738_18860 [Steroidobacteraceae bacterium]|nr:hypothetical protein [Steroidobacteraceae bacterium]
MSATSSITRLSCLLSLITLLASCVWVPHDHDDGGYRDDGGYHDQYREGYYDRDHDRYYHDHSWHQCRDRDDPHCH